MKNAIGKAAGVSLCLFAFLSFGKREFAERKELLWISYANTL